MAKAKKADAEAEAPETGAAEGDAAAPKKGFLSKKLIIMAAAALLVLGGGGGGAWFFLSKKEAHEEKPKPVRRETAGLRRYAGGAGQSVERRQRARALPQAKIVLEVTDEKIAEQIKPVMPRVLDSFQTYLREMRSSDLEGVRGTLPRARRADPAGHLAVAPSRINAGCSRKSSSNSHARDGSTSSRMGARRPPGSARPWLRLRLPPKPVLRQAKKRSRPNGRR